MRPLYLADRLEEPAEEIRNVMHMWPLCNIECGVIMRMLKLQEFRSRLLLPFGDTEKVF